jgi:aminopeptidase N
MRIPGRRYVAVVVKGSAAQEKSTFSLLGTAQLEALLTDETEDWLPAHELAHQFWGNLVTPRSWTEMWISEGLVTFMTAAWKESRWGRATYDREIELAEKRVAAAIEEGFDVPLNWEGEFPSLRLRRAIAYSRGALFFHTMRRTLGDETFWKSIRSMTTRHAGTSISSRDVQREFERISGRDLSGIFAKWVYGAPEANESERR